MRNEMHESARAIFFHFFFRKSNKGENGKRQWAEFNLQRFKILFTGLGKEIAERLLYVFYFNHRHCLNGRPNFQQQLIGQVL